MWKDCWRRATVALSSAQVAVVVVPVRNCPCGGHARQRQLSNSEPPPDWLAGPQELTANDIERIEAETVRMMTAHEDWQAIVNEDRRQRGLDDKQRPAKPTVNERADDPPDPDDAVAMMTAAERM